MIKLLGFSEVAVSPSGFKEDLDKNQMSVAEYVKRTSEGKLLDKLAEVKQEYREENVVLVTGDTIVVHNCKIYEKPLDETEAFEMLKSFSG